MITIVASDESLPPIDLPGLVAAGVRHLVAFDASGGLFYSTRVKNERWINVARLVVELETVFGEPMLTARAALDQLRNDPWCAITVSWDDV